MRAYTWLGHATYTSDGCGAYMAGGSAWREKSLSNPKSRSGGTY